MIWKIGYGFVLWMIPYVTAIPLLPLLQSDPFFFKTIMIVEGSIVGGILTVHYFLSVERNYLREGIVLAAVWVLLNWGLDFVGVVPFSGASLTRYFIEIGLRYIAIAVPAIALGYVLQQKLERAAPKDTGSARTVHNSV